MFSETWSIIRSLISSVFKGHVSTRCLARSSTTSSLGNALSVEAQSFNTPPETLPVCPFPFMSHYIVTIPRDSSSHPQCFFYDDSRTYKHIQVNLQEFTSTGNQSSFDVGLEVGKMTVVENLIMGDEARGHVKIGKGDNEEGGLTLDEAPGAQPFLVRSLSLRGRPGSSVTLALPIPTDTPHYVILIPEKSSRHLTCYLYDNSRTYSLVEDFTNFTDGNHVSFVAGVEVGRKSALENPFSPFVVDEIRRTRNTGYRYQPVVRDDDDCKDKSDQLSPEKSDESYDSIQLVKLPGTTPQEVKPCKPTTYRVKLPGMSTAYEIAPVAG